MRTLALPLAVALGACGPKAPVINPGEVEQAGPSFQWKAFPRVDIVDSGYLVSSVDLSMVEGLDATLTAAGVPQDQVAAIKESSSDAAWPGPLSDPNQRYNHYLEITLMRAHQVAYLTKPEVNEPPPDPYYDEYGYGGYGDYGGYGYGYGSDDKNWVLVAVLADENQHLRPELRPEKDFFAVFVEWGVRPLERVPARPGTEIAVEKFPAVKISDADRIFPYAGIRYVEGIQEILVAAGIPEAAHETVYVRSEEYGWPREMMYDRRSNHANEIPKFKARKIADVGGNVLVMIPASENEHMPEALRPTFDFFFVVEPSAVAKR